MGNPGLLDTSRTQLEGTDTIVMNERTRYSFSSASVNGGTIPANPLGTNWFSGTGATAPTSSAPTANFTITAYDLSKGVAVYASTAARTATLDSASNIVAMMNQQSAGAQVGDFLTCLLVSGSTSAITINYGAGLTADSNISTTTIPATSSRFVTIRLTNVTDPNCAGVVYF